MSKKNKKLDIKLQNKKNTLIIITGSSSSGKTKLLNSSFKNYIKLSPDIIKEEIFDSYYKIKKKRINNNSKVIFDDSSFNIFWNILEELMENSVNCVVEYPFIKTFELDFNKLIKKYDYECILIIVYVKRYNILKRRIDRIKNGTRHKGHHNAIGENKYLKSLYDELKKTNRKDSKKEKMKYIERYNLNILNKKKLIIFDNN